MQEGCADSAQRERGRRKLPWPLKELGSSRGLGVLPPEATSDNFLLSSGEGGVLDTTPVSPGGGCTASGYSRYVGWGQHPGCFRRSLTPQVLIGFNWHFGLRAIKRE